MSKDSGAQALWRVRVRGPAWKRDVSVKFRQEHWLAIVVRLGAGRGDLQAERHRVAKAGRGQGALPE